MVELVDMVLLGFMAVVAVLVARLRNLFGVVLVSGFFSLLSASMFVVLDAVDVAFTEAAVGAGIPVEKTAYGINQLPRPCRCTRAAPVRLRRGGRASARRFGSDGSPARGGTNCRYRRRPQARSHRSPRR